MKAPRFSYHDPASLDEALDLLADHGDAARVLAGGQSLMPVLNFRLARPAHLVDLNRVEDLVAIAESGGGLTLGAMVRQRALERSEVVARRCPLICQALPLVGHPQIRNRGTLGGSLAHADPAAELPAVLVAVDASFVLRSKTAQRRVAADAFVTGQLSTVLQPDELLERVEVPVWPERTGSAIREVAMRTGDFALAGVATTLSLDAHGRVAAARIVCFGVADRPLRQPDAEASLMGGTPGEALLEEAGRIVSARLRSFDDIHASAGYRKRVSGVLTTRALTECVMAAT
ncbi:MAG: xanthine dehydrogenase family protein subunit M [Chloroflexi bacterium]|nr:xanthine dehydrogenase family protein subunit M [Chloroflexota bacterium]